MNITLLKKCLTEARLLFAGLCVLLFVFCWIRVFIVARILDASQFARVIEQFWDRFKDFSPVSLEQLLSYTGRIAVGYNEPMIVFGVSIFAVARGSDVISGELNRGTLEMLLAQPVSRLQVLYTQAAVTIAGLAVLSSLTFAGTTVGIYTTHVEESLPPPSIGVPGLGIRIPLSLSQPEKVQVPMSERTRPAYFAPGAVNLFCLGVALAGFSSLVSACDRYRWRTIGIVMAVYIVSLILKLLGQAFHEVAWLQYLSIFTAYEPQKLISMAVHKPELVWSWSLVESADTNRPLVEFGGLTYNAILFFVGLLSYLAAGVVFHKRDLPAPL